MGFAGKNAAVVYPVLNFNRNQLQEKKDDEEGKGGNSMEIHQN